MSFYYQKYGTFTGIGTYQYTYRDNDDFTNNFYDDGVFNLNDISMVLLNTPQDFVTLHLDGHNTDQLTLEKVQGSFISTVASPGFDYDTYGHYYTYGTSLPIETIKFNVNNFNVGYAGGGDGNTNVKGDFKVNTDKFTVSAPTGNTDVKGDFKVNTDKFTVSAPTGNTDVKGDFKVNTDKFAVNATTGITSCLGDFKVNTNKFTVQATTGITSCLGDFKVNTNKFTVDSSTGDTYIDRDLLVNRNVTADHFFGGLSGTASNVTTNANLTGDITSVGNATAIAAGVIVNADISPSAAISLSKLAQTGIITATTFVGALTGTASGNKVLPFDIPHVTQKGKRIRHIIAEGPEAGIYVRGKIKDTNVIELPEYWDGLIDPETITVTLTQIGYSQDLIVDKIDLGKNIIIRSGVGTNIHCYYEVWASRWINPMNHDEKLIVVYDGETPDDYPGDNKQFLIGGWDYDRRNPYWEPLDETPPVVL